MSKAYAGSLAAHPTTDGSHIRDYKLALGRHARAFADLLLLHDTIVLPARDMVAPAFLASSLGVSNIVELLKQRRLQIVRTPGRFVFQTGHSDGGLLTIYDPNRRVATDAPVDQSLSYAAEALGIVGSDRSMLINAVLETVVELEMGEDIDAVRKSAIEGFRRSTVWRESFSTANPELLRLPRFSPMTGTLYRPSLNPPSDPMTTLLNIAQANIDLHISTKFSCDSVSSSTLIGDKVALSLGVPNSTEHQRANLYRILEVSRVRDLGAFVLNKPNNMRQLIDVTSSPQAAAFRGWFHESAVAEPDEMLSRYMDVFLKESWLETLPIKVARFVFFQLLGMIPGVGAVTGAFDALILDRIASKDSPKFFVQSLRSFGGQAKVRVDEPSR